MLNKETIAKVLDFYRSDTEVTGFIDGYLTAFENYHQAVFAEQTFTLLYSGVLDGEEFRSRRMELDKTRTDLHNSVISSVSSLNRMAEQAGLPPVYDGIVSMDKPYRREVANAVFAFIEEIINNRT